MSPIEVTDSLVVDLNAGRYYYSAQKKKHSFAQRRGPGGIRKTIPAPMHTHLMHGLGLDQTYIPCMPSSHKEIRAILQRVLSAKKMHPLPCP